MSIFDRQLEIPKEHLEGKDVLIVGFMDHNQDRFEKNVERDRGEFAHIRQNSASYTGIDLADADYKELREKGFNVYKDDILTFNKEFEDSFDVVTAVNVLDHIPDLNSFYENVKKYLREDGILIVWDDDLLSLDHGLRRLKGKTPDDDNVFKLSPNIMRNHADMYGFEVVELDYIRPKNQKLDRIVPRRIKNVFFRSFLCVC